MSRQYKEFKVGDLFEVILGVNVPHKHLLLVGEYGVITGSTERNGCAGYLDDIGNYLLKENVITVSNRGEHSGTAFYQDKKVIIGSNVLCLIPKIKLNKYIGLYICVVINNLGYGGYTNYPTKNKIVKDLLLLPITSQGIPDWQYMEDFMKEIESETQQTIETLDKISIISSGGVSSYPEPYGYKEFKVGDLFEYERGKVKAPKQVKEGNIPMVSETNLNNGVDRFVDFDAVHKGGCVTVSVNYARNVFYQEESFCASVNIIIIRNDLLNKYNGLYISSVLSSNNKKYSYTDKISKTKLMDAHISLPITSQGVPDWQYMEDFMRNIEQESEEVINKLQTNV